MEGFTKFELYIPNDREDLIAIIKSLELIAKSDKNGTAKQAQEKKFQKFMSYAGALTGEFEDMSVNEMRANKALRE